MTFLLDLKNVFLVLVSTESQDCLSAVISLVLCLVPVNEILRIKSIPVLSTIPSCVLVTYLGSSTLIAVFYTNTERQGP